MEKQFNNIHYRTATYILNNGNNYYEKQPTIVPFHKLPDELKVEESQRDFLKKQGANNVIRGRVRNGKYLFFTGLIELPHHHRVYFGNNCDTHRGKRKISLIVFSFNSDHSMMTIYYFNHFYKDNRAERISFVSEFISSLGEQ